MICRVKGSKIPDKLFAQGSYDCAGSGLMPPLKTTKLNSGYGSPAFKEGLPKAIIKFLDLWVFITSYRVDAYVLKTFENHSPNDDWWKKRETEDKLQLGKTLIKII